MTLEEKVNLIRGDVEPAATNQGQAGYLPGVPRLGVPSLRFADGPPGVLTRVAGQAQTATMGVAATWSLRDAEGNGVAIGRPARSLGIDVVLQPFINIAFACGNPDLLTTILRDELGFRGFEYWSLERKQCVRAEGRRTLMVGTSSRALPLSAPVPGR